jgi:YHS domain-containing protein
VQDVPGFCRRLGLELGGYLDPTRPALLDAEHCVRLNYEADFFASAENRARFLEDPTRYCGLLTDPVSKRRFLPELRAPRAEHEGVTYLFASESARAAFVRRPERFRLPGWSM